MPKIEDSHARDTHNRVQVTANTRMPSVEHASIVAKVAPQAAVEGVPATPPLTEAQQAPISQPNTNDQALAQLARREKQLHAERKRLQVEKAQLEQFKAQTQSASTEPRKLSKDELSQAIQRGEVTYEDLSSLYLAQGSQESQESAQLKGTITTLQAKLDKLEAQMNQAPLQAREQAIKQIDREVNTLVNNDPAYEVIKHQGAANAVTQYMALHFDDTGELMDVAQAAKQVEAYLEEQALAVSKLNKIQAKLRPPQESTSTSQGTKQTQQTPKQSATSPSITRGMQSSPSQARTPDQERRWRAEQAFYGKLKKD